MAPHLACTQVRASALRLAEQVLLTSPGDCASYAADILWVLLHLASSASSAFVASGSSSAPLGTHLHPQLHSAAANTSATAVSAPLDPRALGSLLARACGLPSAAALLAAHRAELLQRVLQAGGASFVPGGLPFVCLLLIAEDAAPSGLPSEGGALSCLLAAPDARVYRVIAPAVAASACPLDASSELPPLQPSPTIAAAAGDAIVSGQLSVSTSSASEGFRRGTMPSGRRFLWDEASIAAALQVLTRELRPPPVVRPSTTMAAADTHAAAAPAQTQPPQPSAALLLCLEAMLCSDWGTGEACSINRHDGGAIPEALLQLLLGLLRLSGATLLVALRCTQVRYLKSVGVLPVSEGRKVWD